MGIDKDHQIQQLEVSIYQIQEAMKVQNGYNDDTIKQLNDFKGKVEQIAEVIPRKERTLLIELQNDYRLLLTYKQ